MLSPDLAEFLESGVSILVGTRGDRFAPDCMRALGARVEPGLGELTVYLPEAVAESNLANLRDVPRAAICFSRPQDHRSIQIKGTVLEVREAREDERAVVERYRGALAASLGVLGLPPRIVFRVAHWPCRALRVRVESVFVQTPGPGAGAPLARPEGEAAP